MPLNKPDHIHLKSQHQFVALTDIYQHAQNQLYTFFTFWDLEVLIASLGVPDLVHLESQRQFVALIDMHLHAKNQLYNFNVFWDIKI